MAISKHIAFIGSGPISLLKAYLLAKKNPENQYTIIDSNPQFGGAWYSDKSPKGFEIESGCHIWSYSPEVYSYFESEFGLDLVTMKPSPVFVGANFKLPYSVKNTVDTYKYLAKSLLKGKAPRIKDHPGFYTRIIGKKNKYPKLGSVELINALEQKIVSLTNIEILTNTRIESVNLNEKVVLETKDKSLDFDYLYLTSVSEIKSINSHEKTITLKQARIDYIHFLLKLSEPCSKKMTYWRLMNDEVIHRISDISYQTENKENLLLIGIKPQAFESKSEEELLIHCAKAIQKLKLINANTSVELVKTYVFPTYYIEGEIRNQINELAPDQLELIHSTDLIHGFYYILKKEGLI
jgi:protoporphyrinogen oxidase